MSDLNTPTLGGPVHHPRHYNKHPSGVECITVVEHMNFNLGNAVKYIWRADEKGGAIQDLEKALWYIQREIHRREPKVKTVAGYTTGDRLTPAH